MDDNEVTRQPDNGGKKEDCRSQREIEKEAGS